MKYINESVVGNLVNREIFESDNIEDIIEFKNIIGKSKNIEIDTKGLEISCNKSRKFIFEEIVKNAKPLKTVKCRDI